VTSVLEMEILSQGRLLEGRAIEGNVDATQAAGLFNNSVTHLVIAARGSSDNAALYLQYFAGEQLGLLAALATPSLYVNPAQVNLSGAMVVGISQSGMSPDIVGVLRAAQRQRRPSIAITNDPNSPLAEAADAVIGLGVGEESSLAATKTLLASLQAVAQFVQALAPDRELLPSVRGLTTAIDTTTTWALRDVGSAVAPLALDGLTVIGRGLGLCAANECALKVREVAGIRAESYAAPDLLHGPIGAEGSGSTLWLVVTDEIDDLSASDLIRRARESGLTTMATRLPSRTPTGADVEFVLPVDCPNWITPFLTIVVGQVMALRLGEQRHRPIDQPPGLRKITLTN
jgi:glucosamine--fructose-6-phosphate aminotransferase (isomerizing)